MKERLTIWTIYNKPKDFPEDIVAREWLIQNGSAIAMTHCLKFKSLDETSLFFDEAGYFFIKRHESDDPCIVGVWM